ncbi:MAG TPA: type II toxin-antitoxin system death-on-curing family toxin [Microcoleaceae bacterium UBA11344]|nr:type II toxin-antitoxin system death-on-curing family toxin [Microcoleaceae cyanobacterium UBA11344]
MPTPNFITKNMVLSIHARQIERFGGTPGVRDEGLLESALAQPQATFGGQFLHPTIAEQAAAYLYHIAMNHPFIDGNKRSAFAVTDTFLRLNRFYLNLTDEQVYDLVMQVAQGNMTKEEVSTEFELCIVKF